MAMYGEPRVWLSQLPPGELQPFACDYQGIHYPGEVVRAESWSPRWGESLTGDAYFRIVLLQQAVTSPPALHDSRIALCVPAPGEYRQRDRLLEELSTIRQAQTLYLTQRDPEADLIRRTLQLRQEGLEGELISQELTRYSTGAILVAPELGTPPADLIAGTDPAAWLSRIARWLLEQTCPGLPLNADLLPRPVTHQDVVGLYYAIFHQGAQGDAASEPLAELGPGLCLSLPDNPSVFTGNPCPALDLIGEYLSSRPQPVSWPELHYHLAHRVGLTRPLATLYLLVFLHQHPSRFEIRLSPQHHLALAEGQPLTGGRLTADLLPTLPWDNRLADWAITIGPLTQPQWNDTLTYLARLCPDLSPADEPQNVAAQERRLLEVVGQLAQEVARGRGFLAQLQQRAERTLEPARPLSQSLGRLAGICGYDYHSVYQSACQVYAHHRMLEQDVGLLRQLSQLVRYSEEILEVWDYLDNAAVPLEMIDLSIERRGLEAALSPASLLRFSRSWTTLTHQIDTFKDNYANAYRSHHQRVNQALVGYEYQRTSGQLKLRALELLNTMPELGEPAGGELWDAMAALDPQVSRCPVPDGELDLLDAPRCDQCNLTLAQTLPEEDLSRLSIAIDAALGEKNRQLSNLLVERIIHGQADHRLDDFLKIVQASDLSALSNTITEEMVDFIRGILV